MQVGIITVDGRQIGVVAMSLGGSDPIDTFVPDLEDYEPHGRADRPAPSGPSGDDAPHHAPHHRDRGTAPGEKGQERHRPGEPTHHDHEMAPRTDRVAPRGEEYQPAERGRPPLHREGSAETDEAIREAARAHNLDVNTMRGIASIESSMNPSSNANRRTQYKGLYQIGREEWRRFGQGNIYSARDNAMAAARMFEANRNQFRQHYGRDPTDTELYLMHQQGLGFYTRGAMTNIGGNPYPGMRGAQGHESFESGWGRELARRKAGFAGSHPAPQASAEEDQTKFMPGDNAKLGEQFTGTPDWGWDKGDWKDLRKSPNIDDRRERPGGWTTKQLNEMKENKLKGDIERAKESAQEPSRLSREAGFGDLAKPKLDAIKNVGASTIYPPTIDEFKNKYGRDPATDAELEFYNK